MKESENAKAATAEVEETKDVDDFEVIDYQKIEVQEDNNRYQEADQDDVSDDVG